MILTRVRQTFFATTLAGLFVSLVGILSGQVSLFVGDVAALSTVVSTVVQTTATIGAIALALVFLTAQLSVSASRPSILRELYRQAEVYVLVATLLATVVLGYGLLLRPLQAKSVLVDVLLALGIAELLFIFPVLLLQFESLDPLCLAAKLARRIRPRQIVEYGLTEVEEAKDSRLGFRYSLVIVGLRPQGVDPLRPLHEIILESVATRDRVLLGKLLRNLLEPVARVNGVRLTPPRSLRERSSSLPHKLIRGTRRLLAKRFSASDRIHVALAIVHYAVKRSRNLLHEWDGRDIGRHGILTALGDLIWSLSWIEKSEPTIQICLFGALRISEFYRRVEPYGRLEPLNFYFLLASHLANTGKVPEAELCCQILGWIAANTQQLAPERVGSSEAELGEPLQRTYMTSKRTSKRRRSWRPGEPAEDPWREWLRD